MKQINIHMGFLMDFLGWPKEKLKSIHVIKKKRLPNLFSWKLLS